ncbi:MAG: hypothetical protein HYT77_05875 [Deltaproteobacteria bacterium]|nr:hypothetical protein [Deltaproteobacteria bacterium]
MSGVTSRIGGDAAAAIEHLVGVSGGQERMLLVSSVGDTSGNDLLLALNAIAGPKLPRRPTQPRSGGVVAYLFTYQGPGSSVMEYVRRVASQAFRLGDTSPMRYPQVARPPVPGALPNFRYITPVVLASLAIFFGVTFKEALSTTSSAEKAA